MPLPPYLISSASSHAHHALLVKLDAAESTQAADVAVQVEVTRCRGVLGGRPSSSKVAETLIILLTCSTASTTPLDLDFALLPALQLAEGGKARDRRTGYRYLIERLPLGHELGLMLINTVRKDLASGSASHVLIALHTICALPGAELAPAVQPLLVEKRLIEHDVPAVRQRTIQALRSLDANLSLKELARRIRREEDPGVLASVVKAFGDALDGGAREEVPEKRRRQFDTLFAATARNLLPSPLLVQLIRALVSVVNTLPAAAASDLATHVVHQTRSLAEEVALEVTTSSSPWASACTLEACGLVTALHAADALMKADALIEHLRHLLVAPKDKGKARASSAHSSHRKRGPTLPDAQEQQSNPNTRVLVLRCFAGLPPQMWQEGLEEEHMGALMAGVDSRDSTIRRETLRLLAKVDPNLPSLTLKSHLSALSSLSSQEREKGGTRALEAVEIASEPLSSSARAKALAEGLASITASFPAVWLKGVHAAIGYLSSPSLRAPFLDSIAESLLSTPRDPTLAVILATLAVEYDRASSDVVPALLAALPTSEASVQELIVLALIPLEGGARAIETLKKVAESAIPHIGRRCNQVATVLEKGRGWDVVGRAKSRALNDILDALLAVHAEITRPPLEERDSTPTASIVKSSTLRYNYDQPGSRLHRASELAMGRSMLVDKDDDVALDDFTSSAGGVRLS